MDETARLAANVLFWDSGSADCRLQLDGDLDRTLEIATSLESSD